MLKGAATIFFEDLVRHTATTFTAACERIENKFNDGASQAGTKRYLMSLRLSSLDDYCTKPREALARLNAIIERDFKRTPTSFRVEDNKVDILRGAVIELDWAQYPLSMLHREGLSYQQFYSELAHALQTAVDGNRFSTPNPTGETFTPTAFAAWQRQYIRPSGSAGRHGSTLHRRSRTARRWRQFWNYGQFGHKKADCKKPPAGPLDTAVNFVYELINDGLSESEAMKEVLISHISAFHTSAADSPRTDEVPTSAAFFNLAPSHLGNPTATSQASPQTDDEASGRTSHNLGSPSAQFASVSQAYHAATDSPDRSSTASRCSAKQSGDGHVDGTVASSARALYVRGTAATDVLVAVQTDDYDSFLDACIDTGATHSVVGEPQARAYCKALTIPMSLAD